VSEAQGGGLTSQEAVVVKEIADRMRPALMWRLLICPQQPKKTSAGGIALPDDVQDAEQHLQYIGRILAVGPLAGKNERFMPPEYRDMNLARKAEFQPLPYAWPYKEGDWVLYGRYAGMRMDYKGIKLLVVNDDELQGIIASPEGWKIYA
jgi:co-chaperonin GroES (HSP10)